MKHGSLAGRVYKSPRVLFAKKIRTMLRKDMGKSGIDGDFLFLTAVIKN